MNKEEFKNLYHIMFEEKEEQKDDFIIQFDIQNTKFNFFKTQDKHYLCKFSFQFLDEPQRVTVNFKGKNDLDFLIDDTEQNEQKYDLKKFKEYFNPQFQLFKEAFEKFKEFLESKKKIKKQNNILTVVPLDILLNRDKNSQTTITIEGIDFTFNEIQNTFKDTFRVDFDLLQADKLTSEKNVTTVFKSISNQNFYILEILLSKDENDLQNATKIDKQEFDIHYPLYLSKLNKAIKTFLDMNH